MPVPVDDLEAWFENPVTREFLRIIRIRQKEIFDERLFFEGDPNRTQEAMVWRNGAGDMLQEIIDMHDEKTIYFNGEENHAEQFGNLSEGQSSTG